MAGSSITEALPILAEGKTKIIWGSDVPDEVLIESKDDITAGDGLRHDTIPDKGRMATQTTVNCFELLDKSGIPNHFIRAETPTVFRAREVKMIPIELVTRGIAYASYLKRNPDVESGTRFDTPVFEMFAKDDPEHDPLLEYDFVTGTVSRYRASEPKGPDSLIDVTPLDESKFGITSQQEALLARLALKTFGVLQSVWAQQGVEMVDLKIECGITNDRDIIVADVIDNDSWRLWPGGDPGRMMDKQLYRIGQPLDVVANAYSKVANSTHCFFPE